MFTSERHLNDTDRTVRAYDLYARKYSSFPTGRKAVSPKLMTGGGGNARLLAISSKLQCHASVQSRDDRIIITLLKMYKRHAKMWCAYVYPSISTYN